MNLPDAFTPPRATKRDPNKLATTNMFNEAVDAINGITPVPNIGQIDEERPWASSTKLPIFQKVGMGWFTVAAHQNAGAYPFSVASI